MSLNGIEGLGADPDLGLPAEAAAQLDDCGRLSLVGCDCLLESHTTSNLTISYHGQGLKLERRSIWKGPVSGPYV